MPSQSTLTGPPAQRASLWVQHLSARVNRTPKNYAVCRKDLGPNYYARVLLDLHKAKQITKTVLRSELNRIWPEAQPTDTMPLSAWAELAQATRRTPKKAGDRA